MQDRLVILWLTGLFVFQVTSCDRQSFKGFIFSLGEYTTWYWNTGLKWGSIDDELKEYLERWLEKGVFR